MQKCIVDKAFERLGPTIKPTKPTCSLYKKTENPNGKHASIGHSIHKTLFLLFTFHKVICLLIHLGGTN